jgi:hypothetical protein
MAENTLKIIMEKIAGSSAIGTEAPGAISKTVEEGTNKEQTSFFKKAKNVPKEIASFSKSQLGIQFGIGAMLRQSQIATGFLGALFQIMGAIMDAFLMAFAPQFFTALSSMTKLIPVAKAMGESIAAGLEDFRDKAMMVLTPLFLVVGFIWQGIQFVGRILGAIPDALKVLPLILAAGWKLLNHFQAGHWVKAYNMTFSSVLKALKVHGATSGGGAAAAGGKGAMMGMMRIIPWVMIIGIVASIGLGIFSAFSNKKGGSSGEGVDVSGQLGRSYGMSQASQLGTTLNAELSKNVQVFGDGLTPIVEQIQVASEKMTTPIEDAIGRTATGLDQTVELYKGSAGLMQQSVADWIEASKKAWADKRALESATPPPSDPHRNRTSISGGAYTGIGSGATSNEVTTVMKNAAREWANEQRKMTDLQRQNARQAAAALAEEGARAEERHNIWLSKQGINEGDF